VCQGARHETSPPAIPASGRGRCRAHYIDEHPFGAGLADPTGYYGLSVRRRQRGGCPGTPIRVTPLELLGQTVVFENVGGAGGMIGSNRVAKAAPDGYQFVLGGTFMVLNQALSKNPLYNATTDFAPVVLVVEQPVVLIARKDFPANDLSEFIAYARANQAKMQYGSGGVGSMPHLACELLNAAIGINTTHVPYRGGGPMMPDLIAGRIDYNCSLAALAIPQIESKTVKAIAIFAKSRLPILPNLASAHEQGLSNFEVNPWYAFFLPKGTPVPIVQKLREAIIATTQLRPCRRS
jgi:tripartite-type tricarboxylate transporter receptor subunit TctC